MNFLNPLFLFGLAAASLPILIHLLNLRKSKKLEFSTLQFLKELQKSKIRKLKLKQWLLLLLRTLIIICIVLAFARPTIDSEIQGFSSYSNSMTSILLDNSFSMELSDNYGERFRRSKKIIKNIDAQLEEGDRIFVSTIEQNKQIRLENIDDLQIASTRSSTNSFFDYLLNTSKEENELNNNLVIISDLQDNVFSELDTNINLNHFNKLTLIQTGEENANYSNVSIDSLRIESNILKVGMNLSMKVFLKNHSENDINDLVVSLIVNNERVLQRSVNMSSKSEDELSLETIIQTSGYVDVNVSLESDALDRDNQRYLSFVIPEKPKVALFSDINKSFLELSLDSSVSDISELKVIQSQKIDQIDLYENDVLILNTQKLTSSNMDRLANYMNDGGQIIVYSNSNIKDILNEFFLKNSLGSIEELEHPIPLKFTFIDRQHPVFNGVFKGETDNKKIFQSPEIKKALYLNGGRELVKVENRNLINEIKIGKGRMIYIAVKPDLEYSDLPIKGFFPVLNNSLVSYLNSKESKFNDFSSDISRKLLIEKSLVPNKIIKLIDPNDREITLNGVELPSGYLFEFENLKFFGNYKILNDDGKVINSISLNHDPNESLIMNKIDKNLIKGNLSKVIDKDKIQILNENEEFDFNSLKSSIGTELWQLFVILALLFAIAEMLIQKVYKSEVT